MNMEIRCRLCAQFCQSHIEILDNARFLSIIDYFFQVKIKSEDKFPSTVCEECYECVERTWQFKEQVDRAQIVLCDLLNGIDELTEGNVISEEHVNGDSKIFITNNHLSKSVKLNEEVEEECKKEHASQDTNGLKVVKEDVEKPVQETNKLCKKTKKRSGTSKKLKSNDAEVFKDIEYMNLDGSVTPKPEVGGWNTYHWTCSECSSIFFGADKLKDHFSTSHDIVSVRYLCIDCPKIYSKYISFISHVRHHRPLLKFSCDICYKWYPTSLEVENHKVNHNQGDPFHCTVCGKRFRLQSLLNLHSRSHLPRDVKNCYPCNHCPKKFGTRPNLMAHKRIHLGIKDYTCDQCGKSFVQKGNLDNHLLTHDSARPFVCAVCDKSFKSLVRLRKHSLIHSGLKPHQCNVCGKHFRERGTLREHHRIHTGAMPFTCDFCGKCFRYKGILTTHIRQHTGERPYSCTECQHHFTNWPNYNKHMKRRHGINTSVNCRTKQLIPPTGKPNRNPPGTVLAAPQQITQQPTQVICQTSAATLEVYNEGTTSGFYPVLGLYGIPEDLAKGVL